MLEVFEQKQNAVVSALCDRFDDLAKEHRSCTRQKETMRRGPPWSAEIEVKHQRKLRAQRNAQSAKKEAAEKARRQANREAVSKFLKQWSPSQSSSAPDPSVTQNSSTYVKESPLASLLKREQRKMTRNVRDLELQRHQLDVRLQNAQDRLAETKDKLAVAVHSSRADLAPENPTEAVHVMSSTWSHPPRHFPSQEHPDFASGALPPLQHASAFTECGSLFASASGVSEGGGGSGSGGPTVSDSAAGRRSVAETEVVATSTSSTSESQNLPCPRLVRTDGGAEADTGNSELQSAAQASNAQTAASSGEQALPLDGNQEFAEVWNCEEDESLQQKVPDDFASFVASQGNNSEADSINLNIRQQGVPEDLCASLRTIPEEDADALSGSASAGDCGFPASGNIEDDIDGVPRVSCISVYDLRPSAEEEADEIRRVSAAEVVRATMRVEACVSKADHHSCENDPPSPAEALRRSPNAKRNSRHSPNARRSLEGDFPNSSFFSHTQSVPNARTRDVEVGATRFFAKRHSETAFSARRSGVQKRSARAVRRQARKRAAYCTPTPPSTSLL